jgi:hypothetical protein
MIVHGDRGITSLQRKKNILLFSRVAILSLPKIDSSKIKKKKLKRFWKLLKKFFQ